MFDAVDKKTVLEFMFNYEVTQTQLANYMNIQRKILYNILCCKHKPSLYVQGCLYNAMKKIRKEKRKADK